jgi:hypothetical protein
MPLAGGLGGHQITLNLGFQLTLFQPGGLTALLLAHPDLKTYGHK